MFDSVGPYVMVKGTSSNTRLLRYALHKDAPWGPKRLSRALYGSNAFDGMVKGMFIKYAIVALQAA